MQKLTNQLHTRPTLAVLFTFGAARRARKLTLPVNGAGRYLYFHRRHGFSICSVYVHRGIINPVCAPSPLTYLRSKLSSVVFL